MSNFRFFLVLTFLAALVLASCKKEDSNNPVRIDSVWTNTVDTVPHILTHSNINVWIRLQGTGFSGLQRVLCNGSSVYINPNYVTDNSITFLLPSTLPTGQDVTIDSLYNTIKVITTHGSATYYDFVLKDATKTPTIASISYTMPKVGDYIYLDGSYLGLTTEVSFPNGSNDRIPATNFTVISNNQIKVQVPTGAGSSGSIKIICNGDAYYSPAYMFYNQGIFLHSFKEGAIVSGGVSNVAYYNAAEIQAITGLASNPDSALAIPTTASSIPITTSNAWAGYFKFYANIGFQNVINKGGKISGTTSTANLAIQFDLYVNQPWSSGVLALRMNKNLSGVNASYIYNIEPWTTKLPMTFGTGWQTITVPFSSFTGLSLGALSSYINTMQTNAYQSLLGFVNQDVNADGHTPTALTGFQMFIANFRLVPTTKSAN